MDARYLEEIAEYEKKRFDIEDIIKAANLKAQESQVMVCEKDSYVYMRLQSLPILVKGL